MPSIKLNAFDKVDKQSIVKRINILYEKSIISRNINLFKTRPSEMYKAINEMKVIKIIFRNKINFIINCTYKKNKN